MSFILKLLFFILQKLDVEDNPSLIMPNKPVDKVKGSGAEWYHIDFDPEVLKKGAVVNNPSVIKGNGYVFHQGKVSAQP